MDKIGLFLGAGASYELGMPLVWDITVELKKWLTPDKLIGFNYSWRKKNGGYPDHVIADLVSALGRPSFHYEAILGHLQTQFQRNHADSEAYHGLYSWLIEAVYIILEQRHTQHLTYIQNNIRFFDGFPSLIPKDSPLWIFSLNHDLIVECLAAHFGVLLSSGYGAEIIALPRRDKQGKKIGELHAEVCSGEQLEHRAMSFLGPQKVGINLLKIHGALDVFTFRDGKDLLKILPTEYSIEGLIESLRIANEELHFLNRENPSIPIKTTNEINYEDDSGEMQFLRRSLLSGAYKFNSKMSQVLPVKLLDHFKMNISFVTRLVCVGYGFGDGHIDDIIRDWLAASSSRKLEIVNPGIKEIPARFLHLEPQITLIQSGFSDYLDSIAGIRRERIEILEKQVGALGRKNQHNPDKKKELGTFLQELMQERTKSFAEKIKQLPIKVGDIDIKATGMSVEELTKKILDSNKFSIEDALEKFLKDYS